MAGGMAAVFKEVASIDQSEGRTKGLKHVSKEEKSKSSGGVVRIEKKEEEVKLEKPPRLECEDDKRWFIENQTKEGGVIKVSDATLKQEVFISNCIGATIVIENKIKSLMINDCKNTQVVFSGAISSAEIVNCQRVKIQCQVRCPCISIDKTDGITVYLSFEGRDTQILTSKSSEMNLSFPASDSEDAEWPEIPIPEQFQSKLREDGTLETTVSELYVA